MGITERIDAITAIPPEYRRKICPPPRSCKIELTSRCNLRCAFCAQAQELREHGDMDRMLYRRLIVEMRHAGVEELGVFYLGESMMLSWIDDAVRIAKQEVGYPYVFLTTNATLAKPVRLDKLFRAGLDSLKFSLNYADENQFREIARTDGVLYTKMLSNIIAAQGVRDKVERETGHRCGLYASYIEYDGEQHDRIMMAVEKFKPYLDEVYALPLYNQAGFVAGQEREQGWMPTAGNRGRSGALREALPCWSCFTESHISADGRLVACCFSHDNSFDMGDLTKQSFLEAWNSPAFQKLRQAHLERDVRGTVCERCVAWA